MRKHSKKKGAAAKHAVKAKSAKRVQLRARHKPVISQRSTRTKAPVQASRSQHLPPASAVGPHEAKNYFRHSRAIITWSLLLVFVFASLSLISSYSSPTDEGEQSFFKEKLSQVATLNLLSDDDVVTIIVTGDILPARYVEKRMRDTGDYTLPFKNAAEFLKNADITFGNLESPLLPGRNVPKNSMTFRGDREITEGLLFAGYDVLSCANNHTMNYQVPGLTSTIQAFRKAGILFAGCGKNIGAAHTPTVVEIKGKKIAFLAYNDANIPPKRHGEATVKTPGIAKMEIKAVQDDVKNALANGADFVIVSMHAGVEYKKQPNAFQKDFAHAAVDAGASVVVGHHPHVIQPVEEYGEGVIFYSLGNFIFDQFFSEDVQNGLAVKMTLKGGERPEAELFPVRIEQTAPRVLDGEAKEKALSALPVLQ